MADNEPNWRTLEGDGRLMVRPEDDPRYLGYPAKVKWVHAKNMIEMLRDRGKMIHSNVGSMVWVLQKWARENGSIISVTVTYDETGRAIAFITELV